MPRAKRGYKARRRRNRILKAASGYRGKRGTCYSISAEAVHHAWVHMYRHRKQCKRDWRSLWIIRINAAVRPLGISYSKFIYGLKQQNIKLDRKILADLAISDPRAIETIVSEARKHAA